MKVHPSEKHKRMKACEREREEEKKKHINYRKIFIKTTNFDSYLGKDLKCLIKKLLYLILIAS